MTCHWPARSVSLQAAQHGEIGGSFAEPPLFAQRLLQAPEIAGGILHVGLAHLDQIEAHHRIDVDRMGLGALAHDLAMDLRFGGNVDDEIAADLRLAAEAAAWLQGAALVDVTLFGLVPRRDVITSGIDVEFGEAAFGDLDLAARADAAAAADRIEIDAELARRGEHVHALGERAALARRREDDAIFVH